MNNRFRTIALILAAFMLTAMLASCSKPDEKKEPVSPTDTAVEVSSEIPRKHRFDPSDCEFDGMKLGMTTREVKKIVGKPNREIRYSANSIHGAFIDLQYDNYRLEFLDWSKDEPMRLSHVYINNQSTASELTITGGLHLGNTEEEVLSCFDNTHTAGFSDPETVLYDNSGIDGFSPYTFYKDMPQEAIEYASRTAYDDSIIIEYFYLEPPVWNEERTEFTTKVYELRFYISKESNTVVEISISVNPFTVSDPEQE